MRPLPFSFVLAILLTGMAAAADRPMVSTMANVNSAGDTRGFYIVPVQGYTTMRIAGDEAQPQLFEIVRPGGERITLGRLHTSCSCVQLEAAKTTFERGERAFVTLRNVRATPPNGQHYAFYVQIASPTKVTLRHDLFLQSDRFRQQPPMRNAGQQAAYYTRSGQPTYHY